MGLLNQPIFDATSNLNQLFGQVNQRYQQPPTNQQYTNSLSITGGWQANTQGQQIIQGLQNSVTATMTPYQGEYHALTSSYNPALQNGVLQPSLGNSVQNGQPAGLTKDLGTNLTKTLGSTIKPTSGGGFLSGLKKTLNGSTGSAIGAAADLLGSFMPEKTEYSGEKGQITQSIDSVYDGISDAVAAIPVWGTAASAIMKGGKLLGQGVNALGGGTDGMCVCAGTKVFTADGKEINIENLHKEDGIIGWNGEQIAAQLINNFVEPRQKECVKIILRNGIYLKCSFDHPIYTGKQFISAYKLKANDRVAVSDYPRSITNILYVEVVAVIPIGIQTVYNLQADYDHTYLANGIITHNTTTDAILGSSFMNLTPFGLINGFGGQKANTITKDEDAFAQVGASYTGSNSTVDDALKKSGKKYGLFSSKGRNQANEEIAEAARQQNIIQGISQEAMDRGTIAKSMSAINGNRRAFLMQGGYNQGAVRLGRHGMLLERARAIIKAQSGATLIPKNNSKQEALIKQESSIKLINPEEILEFKDGGSIIELSKESSIKLINPEEILEFKDGGSIEESKLSVDDIKDYGTFFKYLQQTQRTDPDYDYESFFKDSNLYQQWLESERKTPGKAHMGDYYKKPTHYTYSTDSKGGKDFGGQWIGNDEVGWTFKASPFNMAQHTFEEMKDYWDRNEPDALLWYGDQFYRVKKDPSLFREGGSINVIPDGALHARKHNMDLEGITKKGIPVIDNEGEQQAEIEKEEVIFRLEVTQKLEELTKKYYDEKSSQKEKDEYALEAGKLITEELLHNTQDNAGLLENC